MDRLEEKKMIDTCCFCQGTVESRRIRHIREWGDKIFILENVPAEVCRQCGEKYFDPDTVRKMDAIVTAAPGSQRHDQVPVYSL